MDERSNRRLLILIAGLVVVVLALAILTLRRFVGDIKELVPWPIPLAISFNVIVLVVAAVITVGHLEPRPVAKFLALVVGIKAVETVLTAGGYVLTVTQAAFGPALLEAGLASWLASVLHAIGALVVCWLLREMLMGRRLALEAPPDAIILPHLEEPEMDAGEPEPEAHLWLAPPEPGVDPLKLPAASQREQAEGEEELDRVVAGGGPITADLEAMPPETAAAEEAAEPAVAEQADFDRAEAEARPVPPEEELEPAPVEPETAEEAQLEPIEAAAPEQTEPYAQAPPGEAGEIILTVSEILGCFKPENVALGADEVRERRGGDNTIRVPLDIVLPQVDNGVVVVAPELIFVQLPSDTFARPQEEIVSGLWQHKVELPLARVVAQVPAEALARTYEGVQATVDEFPNLFVDSLAGEIPTPQQPTGGPAPEPPEEAAPELVEEAPPEPVEAEEPPAERVEVVGAAEPIQEVPTEPVEAAASEPAEAMTPALVEATAPQRPEGPPPSVLNVNAEYIVAQFPDNATTMPIEDIESKLRPRGKLQVPYEEVLPQLAEGRVAIDVTPLLEQFPPGAIGMSWADLRDSLLDGKVRLPLEQLVSQIPADALSAGVGQTEQETTDEIPEPFHEEAPAGPEHAEPEPAEAAARAEAQQAEAEGLGAGPAEGAGEVLEIPWLDLLPQFPADAFCVSRDRLQGHLEGKTARIEMDLVRPQLAEGRVTAPCGVLLAQFPDEYLELSVEQIAERMPDGRFEIPLVSVVLQLPPEELALPTDQEAQESVDEIPTIFAEAAEAEAAQETEAEALSTEPEEMVVGEPEEPDAAAFEAASEELGDEPVAEAAEPVPGAETPPSDEASRSAGTAEKAASAEELNETDVEQLETLLAEKRHEHAGADDENELVDDLFAQEHEEAPAITIPLLEPEGPEDVPGSAELAEEPVAELFEGEASAIVEEADAVTDEVGPVADEVGAVADEVGPVADEVGAVADEVGPVADEISQVADEPTWLADEVDEEEPITASGEETALEAVDTGLEETVEAAGAELVEAPTPELVEEAAETFGAVSPEPVEREPGTVDLTAAAHEDETFRGLLHGYAKYHVEHGNAYLEQGRAVFSFTPAETSAETLALELPPRLDALARFARQLGCDPLERAVLIADKGAIVCEWLPEETRRSLLLVATADKRAAGMMHIEAHRDTESLGRLSAQLCTKLSGADRAGREPGRLGATEGCEIEWPDGPPFDEIGGLLSAYQISTVALLQFASGGRWMLASSVELDERAITAQHWYDPGELIDLPESLRLGPVGSVLAITGGHIITLNAPAPGTELGLVCVFPNEFREGLLRMKADKASALLAGA